MGRASRAKKQKQKQKKQSGSSSGAPIESRPQPSPVPPKRTVLMFNDPHPQGRINQRLFTGVTFVLSETALPNTEAERAATADLIQVANKLATTYRHMSKYQRVEQSRLEAARKVPLRVSGPVDYDPELYRTCDDFLVQLRDGLNRTVRFPRHFFKHWPFEGMPESVDTCVDALRRMADGDKPEKEVVPTRLIVEAFEKNRDWIDAVLTMVREGLSAQAFTVFASALEGEGQKDHVPMWTDVDSVGVVMGRLWDGLFMLAEEILGAAVAPCLPDGWGLLHKRVPFDSLESPWEILKPKPATDARLKDSRSYEESLALNRSDRPMLQVPFQGQRYRIVGSRVIIRPLKETFHEFLWGLLRTILGDDWYRREEAKPEDEQHHIVRWFGSLGRWKRQTYDDQNRRGEAWGALPSGDVQALTSLAYDVYTLEHSMALPGRLLERLKDHSEFQGARYEIATAAIFVRADFKLEFLEGSGKHCEFIAAHPSGQRIGVEAKSRRRAGVLHQKGPIDPLAVVRGDVQSLFEDAKQQKPGGLPFLIFIDLNAPPGTAGPGSEPPWLEDLKDCLETHDATAFGSPDPFNALVVTNFSAHYFGDQPAERVGERLLIAAKKAADPLPAEILHEIWAAVGRYGAVPDDPERFESPETEHGDAKPDDGSAPL